MRRLFYNLSRVKRGFQHVCRVIEDVERADHLRRSSSILIGFPYNIVSSYGLVISSAPCHVDADVKTPSLCNATTSVGVIYNAIGEHFPP